MADFDVETFTKQVGDAYEQKVATLLPRVKLGYVSNPDEQLSGLGQKFSKPISFEDASIKMEWTPNLPEPEAFADALAEAAASKVESSTVADKEFEARATGICVPQGYSQECTSGASQASSHIFREDLRLWATLV